MGMVGVLISCSWEKAAYAESADVIQIWGQKIFYIAFMQITITEIKKDQNNNYIIIALSRRQVDM